MTTEAQRDHLRRIASLGGYARAAKLGGPGSTVKARAGLLKKFEREADERFGPFPDTEAGRGERAWRAERLRRQFYADLARRSARARRLARNGSKRPSNSATDE